MKKQRTTFKDNAVKLSLKRKNVSELAHELGISPALMYRRRKEYQERGGSGFPGNGVRSLEGKAGRVVELERRLKEAETEHDISKKSFRHHLHERLLIYRFIKDHSKKWTIEMMCRVLNVSRSSYYRRLKDQVGKRKRKSMKLSQEIKDAYFNAKGSNGSPRLAKDLQASGVNVSRTTVARHMKKMDLRSKLSKKFKVTTDASHNYNVAPNLLNRDFNQKEPMQACVSDITYISCKYGFLYLTCVIDLFDRKLIGWSISDKLTASGTVIPAIRMAHRNRPIKEDMILHSDSGIQYARKQTVNLLQYYRVDQSMSDKGNCWDSAVAESFFKSFKTELIYGTKLKTKKQMRLDVFEYIESWYNHKRRFSAFGNLTIDEFRNQYNLKKESIKNVA